MNEDLKRRDSENQDEAGMIDVPNPLVERYATREMLALWSEERKIALWRQMWIILAETERELGLDISQEQIDELKAAQYRIDLAAAREYEKRFRHDVMAHVHAFGAAAPGARAIIHLGATSAFVTDNTDLVIMRDALELLRNRLLATVASLADFARRWRDLPALGFTHFQPAQLTTVGKRACLWIQDLLFDVEEIDHRLSRLRLRGAKGTTGTQASFLSLFHGDHAKVRELDRRIAAKLGFSGSVPVAGQTYTRKIDCQIVDALSGICQSAHKFAVDLRLLAHRREVEEPFEEEQIGSSAMPYKRNPMRAERICSLARFVMALAPSLAQTQANQWLERTLDDSAIRRLVLPQAFLGVDAVLRLYANVAAGLVVYPSAIARGVEQELPFMAAENILMAGVAAGGDRQVLHEVIRRHSQAAAALVKAEGKPNDLLERLKGEPLLATIDWQAVLDARSFVGRAPEQVDEFLAEEVAPRLTGFVPRPIDAPQV